MSSPEWSGLPLVRFRATAVFCLRFAVAFLLLNLAWAWLRPFYETAFSGIARPVYNLSPFWEVDFDRSSGEAPANRLRAVVANPKLMKRDGSGPVRNVDIDIEAFGWRPIAVVTALAVSVAFPPRRRVLSWVATVAILQAFAILVLGLILWADSRDVGFNAWPSVELASRGVALRLLPVGIPILVWLGCALFFTGNSKRSNSPSYRNSNHQSSLKSR